MVQLGTVIELDSSPEPEPTPAPPRFSQTPGGARTRKTPTAVHMDNANANAHANARLKLKGKANASGAGSTPQTQTKAKAGVVIELTDSDSEMMTSAVRWKEKGKGKEKVEGIGRTNVNAVASGSGSTRPRARGRRETPLFVSDEDERSVVDVDAESDAEGVGRGRGRVNLNLPFPDVFGMVDVDEDSFVGKAAGSVPSGSGGTDANANAVASGSGSNRAISKEEGGRLVVMDVDNPDEGPGAPLLPVQVEPPAAAAAAQPIEPPAQPSPPPPTPPPPPAPSDPDTILAHILEIIPNVDPTHLLNLIHTHLADADADAGEATARVLHALFEDPAYPKVDPRGKRKAEGAGAGVEGKDGEGEVGEGGGAGEREGKRGRVDWASVDRVFEGGRDYFEMALAQLQTDFAHIPKPYLRRTLQAHKSLYAPTHLFLLADEKKYPALDDAHKRQPGDHVDGPDGDGVRPYSVKMTRHNRANGKGKGKDMQDAVWEEERKWLVGYLEDGGEGGGGAAAAAGAEGAMEEEDEDEEGDIECQCCFGDYPFAKMVQCPEAHLFCSACISTYASTQLSSLSPALLCMHPSGTCHLPFPPSELQRILPATLFALYERLKQQKEVEDAGLEGLEACPFCEWRCVLEAGPEEEKLFSCRGCGKLDHLPKSCKEMEEDELLDGRHAIEEAMSRALMRNCPKCKKAFIKEQGCNKMTCPNCGTYSCYVCRAIITGYDHFHQQMGLPSTSTTANRCMLHDNIEERHAEEVKAAAEKATAEYKRTHPDVDDGAIKVDIPVVPARPAALPVDAWRENLDAVIQRIVANDARHLVVQPPPALPYPQFGLQAPPMQMQAYGQQAVQGGEHGAMAMGNRVMRSHTAVDREQQRQALAQAQAREAELARAREAMLEAQRVRNKGAGRARALALAVRREREARAALRVGDVAPGERERGKGRERRGGGDVGGVGVADAPVGRAAAAAAAAGVGATRRRGGVRK
ncbi:hypothetical protein B0H34DRAFT_716125 [Crassisporium funariophilum]|nr:hypothetical protein B0H34DRAFT_716125 [Crassisporium funariophilum]